MKENSVRVEEENYFLIRVNPKRRVDTKIYSGDRI